MTGGSFRNCGGVLKVFTFWQTWGSTSSVEKEGLKNSTCVKGEALVRGLCLLTTLWSLQGKGRSAIPGTRSTGSSGLPVSEEILSPSVLLHLCGVGTPRVARVSKRWNPYLLPKVNKTASSFILLRRRRLTLVPQCPNWNCGSLCCQLEERTPVIGRADKGEAHTAEQNDPGLVREAVRE